MWPSNLMDDLEKPVLHQALCIISNLLVNWNCIYSPETLEIWVKIGDFLSCVTLKFDGWPWQTIGHLFYATSSFVNHFKAIGEFKLEWRSGNAQFRSKFERLRYLSFVTLKFQGWPWKTIGHLFHATSRFEQHFIAICEFKLELQSEKSQFWVKVYISFSPVTLKFDG